jgi:hypothetical protein
MVNNNIYYINIKPYIHDIKFDEMLLRFKNSEIGKEIIDNDIYFENLMMEYINIFKYIVIEKSDKEYEVDKVLGKHIISHLQVFFDSSVKNKTIKNRGNKKNKTYKKYNKN